MNKKKRLLDCFFTPLLACLRLRRLIGKVNFAMIILFVLLLIMGILDVVRTLLIEILPVWLKVILASLMVVAVIFFIALVVL